MEGMLKTFFGWTTIGFCLAAPFDEMAEPANSSASPTKLTQGDYYAKVNGVQLHYIVAGEGPLLFVTSPGWGIGSTYLQRGMQQLEKDFTLLFIDTRGSGKSTRPTDATQMGSATMADDIEQLRINLGLESINIMGHSNGGAIALSYAERYATHLNRLILIDSQLIGFSGSDATAEFLKKAANDPRYREAASHAEEPTPTSDEGFAQQLGKILPLYFYDPLKNMPLMQRTMDGTVSAWAEHAQESIDSLPSADQSGSLKNVRAKTLILVGRYDFVCPVVVSERLHSGISDSELVVFEQTGHLPWIEEPERFLSELSKFFSI
jgi:proline iminopeptidase